MYLPAHFTENDLAEIKALVAQYPLCTLVTHGASGIVANHLPMLWRDETSLIGHIALANPLHKFSLEQSEFLAIFQGEDSYISPNWYPSKQQHHKHVPTWNYRVVHLHGRVSFHLDQATKASIVGQLTRRHETETNGEAAWRMADAPPDYMRDMLSNIVGLTFHIERCEAKSKLSQNRDSDDVAGVVAALRGQEQADMASVVERMLRPDND